MCCLPILMVATVPAQTPDVRKLTVVQGAQARNFGSPILAEDHAVSAMDTQS